ncbi:restriction endonuclease subunit S [Sorangium sp. So ce693]|uniref:restriction endonuclease subunit S n=1 Tax=Sorangium sp. So ce693 TaxID=3133318 RepID=UPI003F5FE790
MKLERIPKGWRVCLLGDEITLQRGVDITKATCRPGSIPVVSSGGVTAYHDTSIADGPGVLLGRKGSVGAVHYVEGPYWPHDTTLWVKDFKGNVPRFVYHFFGQFPIGDYEASTSNPTLNRNNIHPVEVLWPPIPEQRRIADILDKADAIRRKRKEAIALTEELLRSAFLEMFGDPVANPKKWSVIAMGDAISSFEAGWSANGEPRVRNDDEYGVLKVSSVTSGYFRPEEHKAVFSGNVDRELVTPRRGDLIFSRANTQELVAACCLVEQDDPRLFLPDKLWRIVPEGEVVTAEFLKSLLSHPGFRFELTKRATGTSGSMLNISMEKVRSVAMPAPPLLLQRRFSSLVWRVYEARARQIDASRVGEELFDSLVRHAFQGDLARRIDSKAGQMQLFAETGSR